jgi:hypothetical protein
MVVCNVDWYEVLCVFIIRINNIMVKVKCPHRTSIMVYIAPLVECAILTIILLGTVSYVVSMSAIENIRKNWDTLKCNPSYLIFYPAVSKNIEADVISCVRNIMTNSIGDYLSPLTKTFSSLTDFGIDISDQLQQFRGMLDYIRTNIGNLAADFFGYILKVLLIFYKFQVAIKQILSRFIGIIVSSVYLMQGQMHLSRSIWNGPPGQLVRALSSKKIGHCFCGNTLIETSTGERRKISELSLGEELTDGGIVWATMQIQNAYNEPFYSISGGVDGKPILVSGTHYVYSPIDERFQIVETLFEATVTDIVPDVVYCLITSTNNIPIGKRLFWDWEDYKINRFA